MIAKKALATEKADQVQTKFLSDASKGRGRGSSNPEETTATLRVGALFVVKGTLKKDPAITLVTVTPTIQGTTRTIALPVETSTKCPTDGATSIVEAAEAETAEAIDWRLLKEEVESLATLPLDRSHPVRGSLAHFKS